MGEVLCPIADWPEIFCLMADWPEIVRSLIDLKLSIRSLIGLPTGEGRRTWAARWRVCWAPRRRCSRRLGRDLGRRMLRTGTRWRSEGDRITPYHTGGRTLRAHTQWGLTERSPGMHRVDTVEVHLALPRGALSRHNGGSRSAWSPGMRCSELRFGQLGRRGGGLLWQHLLTVLSTSTLWNEP